MAGAGAAGGLGAGLLAFLQEIQANNILFVRRLNDDLLRHGGMDTKSK